MKKILKVLVVLLMLSGCSAPIEQTALIYDDMSMREAERTLGQRENQIMESNFLTLDKQGDLNLAGISLGDPKEKVIRILGTGYKEERMKDASGYIGEDYSIWHYGNDIDVLIGQESKKVLTLSLQSSDISTPKGVKVGDKAGEVLPKYRKEYSEVISPHTNHAIKGWFELKGYTVLIFDFDGTNRSRYNKDVTEESVVQRIELTSLRYFD